MWVPFLRPFPGNEAHNFFSGGLKWGFRVGCKKFMLKEFMCFFPPLILLTRKMITLGTEKVLGALLAFEAVGEVQVPVLAEGAVWQGYGFYQYCMYQSSFLFKVITRR